MDHSLPNGLCKNGTRGLVMTGKIGIATIVRVNNYGAELQAFATQRKLSLMGYDSELIDYRYYKAWNFKDSKMSASLLPKSSKEKIIYWTKYRLINAIAECVLPLFVKPVKRRINRFESFHKKNSVFSRLYASMDDLYQNPPQYAVYMTGSDQVWNPSASSSIEPYFLTFAPTGKKKIAYASSFGIVAINNSLKDRFGKWLRAYDDIAVREDSAVALVKELSGKDATWVIDPTLLLTKKEWMSVAEAYPGMPSRYVLVYDLSNSISIDKLALKIGKKYDVPVYRICKRAYGMDKKIGIINILDAGPAEFVSLIANAKYVVTNSFHGTAFSINFGVSFFTVLSNKKKNNSRIESLLGLVKLKNRIIYDDVPVESVDVTSQIDFDAPHVLLEKQRNNAELFLSKALCKKYL